MEDLKIIEKVIKMCKKHHISHFKCDGFEFDTMPQQAKKRSPQKPEVKDEGTALNNDFLLWSTPDWGLEEAQ
jgi:hypothetical protein